MLLLLSPAKSLSLSRAVKSTDCNREPKLSCKSNELVRFLQRKSKNDIKKLFRVSDSIAALNHAWFQQWEVSPSPNGMLYPAGYIYDGPAFRGLDYSSLSTSSKNRAENHLRIISGIYGILCPEDLIQPYRLEMSTKLALNDKVKSLYDFWGGSISNEINIELQKQSNSNGQKILINLASEEYFKAIQTSTLDKDIKVIQCVFKDKGRVVSVYAKRARGLMARFILEQPPMMTTDLNDKNYDNDSNAAMTSIIRRLQDFSSEGYFFVPAQSTEDILVFNRTTTTAAPAPAPIVTTTSREIDNQVVNDTSVGISGSLARSGSTNDTSSSDITFSTGKKRKRL
eukprot:gene9705-20178_t